MTEYFEISRISRRFSDLKQRSFLTIFRQLSDNKSESKAAPAGLEPSFFRDATRNSTTAPHSLYIVEGSSVLC
jgi:hypothetical protein